MKILWYGIVEWFLPKLSCPQNKNRLLKQSGCKLSWVIHWKWDAILKRFFCVLPICSTFPNKHVSGKWSESAPWQLPSFSTWDGSGWEATALTLIGWEAWLTRWRKTVTKLGSLELVLHIQLKAKPANHSVVEHQASLSQAFNPWKQGIDPPPDRSLDSIPLHDANA